MGVILTADGPALSVVQKKDTGTRTTWGGGLQKPEGGWESIHVFEAIQVLKEKLT